MGSDVRPARPRCAVREFESFSDGRGSIRERRVGAISAYSVHDSFYAPPGFFPSSPIVTLDHTEAPSMKVDFLLIIFMFDFKLSKSQNKNAYTEFDFYATTSSSITLAPTGPRGLRGKAARCFLVVHV